MTAPQEEQRLQALYRHNILDTPPSESFDRITRMASQIFDLPIAAISLTDHDRQWFKSKVGFDHQSTPRDKAPCAQVAESAVPVVIPDLLNDACYSTSILSGKGIRFYAGAPLTTPDGFTLGALCVLGTEPRMATEREMTALSDLAAMVMSQIELQHALGRTDAVTGLPNQLQFVDDFAVLPAGVRRLGIMIDLVKPDELQQLTHVLGPTQVEEQIRQAARIVLQYADTGIVVYQVSATNFVMIAAKGIDEERFFARLIRLRADTTALTGNRFAETWSVGIAPFETGTTTASDVLRMAAIAAEEARYSVDRVCFFSSQRDEQQRRRFRILNDFPQALQGTDQLRLVFQPRIDLRTGILRGVEALLRWTHPDLGEIAPGEFIPVIEQTPLARETTAWVLDQALRQHATWRALGLDIHLSVNISARNLCEAAFVGDVEQAMTDYDLDASLLELELTESAVMTNGVEGRSRLEGIAALGVRIAIDDFGTGYSSLSYLQELPADVVKIDKSFIATIEFDDRRRRLVRTMIKLSHDLGYEVVAEGVETTGAEAILKTMGCDEVQGYLYARPLEPENLLSWVRERAKEASAERAVA